MLLLSLLDRVLPLPITANVFGFAVSLLLAAMVHDATRWRELETMLLGVVPALGAAALAIVLHAVPFGGDAALVAILATAIYAQSHASRWPPLGTVAVISYVITLVTHPPLSELPLLLLVIFIAIGACVFVRIALWPERPAVTVAGITRSIHHQIAALLATIENGVRRGAWAPGTRHRLRRGLVRLAEATVLASAKLDPQAQRKGEALHFTELELATDRTVWVALHHMPPPADRPRVLASLQAVRRILAGRTAPALMQPSGLRLETSLAMLGQLLSAPRRDSPVEAISPPPPLRPRPVGAALHSTAQAALASAIAVFGGHLISPTRYYWAAFAAYVVFQGTQSSGQSFMKGVRFVVGTAGGVIGGVLIATLLAGHTALLLVGTILAVFLAFNASTASYGAMIFWITIILALMFSLIGYFTPGLLVLRLEEGVFGVACGTIVSAVVWGVRTGDIVMSAQEDYLQALAAVTRSATDSMVAGHADPELSRLILGLQAGFRAVWDAMGSVISMPSRRVRLRRRASLLSACDYWARELGWYGNQATRPVGPEVAALMGDTVARIERATERLCTTSDRLRIDATLSNTWIEEAAQAQAALARIHDDLAWPSAAHLLLRIEAALFHLLAEGSGIRYATIATAWPAPS